MTWWEITIHFLENLDAGLKLLLGLLAAVALFGKKVKNGVTWFSNFFKKVDSAMDTLNGREAIRHPDTGAVLAEATMPLSQRINAIETNQAEMNSAIKLLAENQTRMMKVEDTLADVQKKLEERDAMGNQIIEAWEAWREEFSMERVTEHQRLWEAIDAIKRPS